MSKSKSKTITIKPRIHIDNLMLKAVQNNSIDYETAIGFEMASKVLASIAIEAMDSDNKVIKEYMHTLCYLEKDEETGEYTYNPEFFSF